MQGSFDVVHLAYIGQLVRWFPQFAQWFRELGSDPFHVALYWNLGSCFANELLLALLASNGLMKAAQLMRDHGWLVLLAIFPTCSFAGLAALLRSEQPLTRRAIASSILNSGCLGVATAALMMHQFGNEAMHLIIGISILSGLGGNTAVDFVLQMARAWIKHREDDYE